MTNIIKSVEKDSMVLYVMDWPVEFGSPIDDPEAFVVPVLQRQSGILIAVPLDFVPRSLLEAGNLGTTDGLVGPSTEVTIAGMEEDEHGNEQALDVSLNMMLVDFGPGIVGYLTEFDPAKDTENVRSFFPGSPQILPQSTLLMERSFQWLLGETTERLQYYSADEDFQILEATAKASGAPPVKATPKKKVTTAALAEQLSILSQSLPQITEQLQVLQAKQSSFETALQVSHQALATPPHRSPFPVSREVPQSMAAFAKAVGPAPRTRLSPTPKSVPPLPTGTIVEEPVGPISEIDPGVFQDAAPANINAAILQQSQAMNALVAHLVNQDLDMASSSAQNPLSMRGASKRERLQADLASRSGNFFLQVAQNALRRTRPTDPLPARLEDLPRKAIFSKYLERQGGFAECKEVGLTMWLLAQVADAMVMQDQKGAQELLALTMVTLEQVAQDGGKWEVAYVLSLQQDPPQTLFTSKSAVANPRLKAFAPLCPQGWATTTLTYLKELDVITQRRSEAQKPTKEKTAEEEKPNPKRKQRFPKKPREETA